MLMLPLSTNIFKTTNRKRVLDEELPQSHYRNNFCQLFSLFPVPSGHRHPFLDPFNTSRELSHPAFPVRTVL